MASEPPADGQWVTLALLTGPRGNRGELEAVSFSGRLDRFRPGTELYVAGVRGLAPESPLVLESLWEHRGRMVFKFQGIDTISEAERLRGGEVRVPLRDRPLPPAGEYYESDLVGCEVIERASGRQLGRVRRLVQYGGPALLELEGPDGEEVLVPFARSICVEIDTGEKRIRVDLPAGLKDLNR